MKSAIAAFMESVADAEIGVAVSGGGDSMALLVALADWAQEANRKLKVATVDHQLRNGSAQEAKGVGKFCARLGLEHSILHWDRGQGGGNLQDAARKARQDLLEAWARENGIATIATGHTRDDLAETFLMRLKRGSGVDGLAAMQRIRKTENIAWIRPLLDFRRAELRDFLQRRAVLWVDDPSNQDTRFDRVVMRNALGSLDKIGLSVDVLADTAARMSTARDALEAATFDLAQYAACPRTIGSVRLDVGRLTTAPAEIQLRLVAHALCWVSGAPYRPRLTALKDALRAAIGGKARTLSGCLIAPCGFGWIEVTRECAAMQHSSAQNPEFDGRWACSPATGEWRALGESGIVLRPNWRETGESRHAVLASPSLWLNNELMSAPLLDNIEACRCWLRQGTESFFVTIVTH
jgi:tRNA(Ile)-lysidine synthase